MASFKQFPLHPVVIPLVLLCGVCLGGFGLFGCGNDESNGVNPEDKLCRGEHGVAARITGTPEPLDMCVSDGQTVVDYIPIGNDQAKYHITAIFATGDLTIEIQVSFFAQPVFPTTLTLTANQGLADSDPGAAWFYYQETKLGVYDYVSSAVTGVFTVTFNDPSIAVATFHAVEVELDEASSGNPAGVRNISEGYASVTVE